MDEAVFRQQVRELKRRIRDDEAFRAKVDVDGDGEISGPEWERAVALLRRHLEKQEADAADRTLAEMRATGAAPAAGAASASRPEAPPGGLHEAGPPGLPQAALSIASSREVAVRQVVEGREVLIGYETANRYEFVDVDSGQSLGGADEERGGFGAFFVRQMLGPGRPVKITMIDQGRSTWLEGIRPFKLLGFIDPPAMTVSGQQGPVGSVKRVWPLGIARRYEIEVFGGRTFRVNGRLFSPWTYPIELGGRQVALIKKKWSGFLKEGFTDADTFHVTFEDSGLDASERLLFMAAALCVDFDFFEKGTND